MNKKRKRCRFYAQASSGACLQADPKTSQLSESLTVDSEGFSERLNLVSCEEAWTPYPLVSEGGSFGTYPLCVFKMGVYDFGQFSLILEWACSFGSGLLSHGL